ncbi:threonylcarbamoyl-AMP synthase [Candidatus Peregrinibacteria bacterium CG10_big_fil_rev_8_21_14_0_10_49_10]|nr:MAG: threonylcarbamoyl-AMP synthase [Candidatus Peregrinibacteria bacterium CG10_big_fil_rev_8_21_14_0_10_49_10]
MENLLPTPKNIARAVELLHDGGIVCHATETCYGLACDVKNADAVRRLFALKQRPEHMPVSALFEHVEQAKLFVEWNALADQLVQEHLPGPLTIIVPLLPESGLFPTPLGGDTLGVRVSPHPVAGELVRLFGSPISTTSANRHGEPNTYAAKEMADQFEAFAEKPDLILDSGVLERNASSSVVSVVGGNLEMQRKGPLIF